MLIAVAPNGARKTIQDHPALPITPLELAHTAAACAEASAGMIHLHVRDDQGNHTLEPSFYLPALKEVEAAVGERMLIQVTSEAAAAYHVERQMELMRQLAPHCLSCGLREFVADESHYESGARFFADMKSEGVLIQYILYSADDVRWYEELCGLGVIPGEKHLLLFVLGRYQQEESKADLLDDYLSAVKRDSPWMVCGFDKQEHLVVGQAVRSGGHARVGFENNLHLSNGDFAPDNAALVKMAVKEALYAGRVPVGKEFAKALF